MLSNFFLKSFRILLFPFSLLYWVGIAIRNKLFDKNILKSSSFTFPLICVGNLSAGGTGKSPMVEYLVQLLKSNYKVATLSRGYKRKTKGYALATNQTTALEIGDEPMQFHLKFPDIPVAVGEERLVAIPQLLQDRPSTEVIILDDAFQHRSVKAGLNILLTEYSNLFTRDFYLPTGDLRDLKSEYKRANIIVVTKCKAEIGANEKRRIINEIKPQLHQHIFFTSIEYGAIKHLVNQASYQWNIETEVLLVTGIANPKPLKKMVEEQTPSYHLLQYADHHIFTIDDLAEIKKRFKKIETTNKIILTTEKDAVRLMKFEKELADWPIYVVPVKHHFLFDENEKFDSLITDFISQFKTN
jgi:tetraacyldisaccharide 4'-kinase